MSARAPVFLEVQRFTQNVAYRIVVVASTAVAMVMVMIGLRLTYAALGMTLWLVLVTAAANWAALTTSLEPDGLRLRFGPFGRPRLIPFADVRAAESLTLRPIRDFGGWGPRPGLGGQALTVYGSGAVLLTLASGERLFIGTQRAVELASKLRTCMQTAEPVA